MKVVLRADVQGVGKRGDILEVADGFSRNYLLPTGISLDRRKLVSDEPIKTLGTHDLGVRLHSDVEFRLTIEVVPAN